MGQSLYTVRIKPRQTPRECLIPAVIDRLYPSSAVAPRPVARVADRPAGVTFQYDRHRHVRDLHHVHVRQGDRQGTCAFDRACFDCFVYARARRSRRSRTAVGGAESIALVCGGRGRGDRSRGSIAGNRSRASASSSSRRPRARVACVEFYVLRRHIHARACDVARRRRRRRASHRRPLRKPLSRMRACVRACVRGLTVCDVCFATLGAIPRSRVEELPSSRAGVLRRAILRQRRRGTYDARARARARILVTPRGRRRVDRVSIASHRSMRSIDQMIDRCDRSIDRSIETSKDGLLLGMWRWGLRAYDRTCGVCPTDRFFLPA